MKRFVTTLFLVAAALPLAAQRRVDVIVDVEGVRRSESADNQFVPGTTQLNPRFHTGGGLGGGVNWFFGDRLSLETKVSALETDMNIQIFGADSVASFHVGRAYIYPISAIVQWHLTEHGALRPYIGAGVSHIILHNIEHNTGVIGGVRFKDPTGVVVDGGVEWRLSDRWSFNGDAPYVPIETNSTATFIGTGSSIRLHVKPLIAGFGLAYHY